MQCAHLHCAAPSVLGRWWDREFKDETNDPNDVYDKGSPDYQDDYDAQKTKDLKWRIVCAGVQRLIEQQGLDEADVMLWFDWQSSALHGSSNPGLQPRTSPAAHARSLCPPQSTRTTR